MKYNNHETTYTKGEIKNPKFREQFCFDITNVDEFEEKYAHNYLVSAKV